MLRVLHYSDIEAAYDTPERVARLAGTIQARRDANTLVFGTGDTTAPGVLSLVTEGAQALDLFEAVEPHASTFGNHDFDYGLERTCELVAASPQTWISSNTYLDGERFGSAAGVRPWHMFDVASHTVGVFGVLDPETPSLNPAAGDLTVTDPIEAGRQAAQALRGSGADIVVALSHLGQGDEELAIATEVDAVLGGHVHSERVERLADSVLTRPGVNGHVVLEVVFDDGTVSVTRHEVTDGPLDTDLLGQLQSRQDGAGLDEVVGRVAEPIERTERTVFRGESRIGNFVADAYRWAAETDVALQNSGGIREGEPLEGAVTVGDLVSIVPFEEPVAIAEVSGAKLWDVFEEAHGEALAFGERDWWHAHVSGAELYWDHDSGSLESVHVGGAPLDTDATYSLATTDYLFYTATEFTALNGDDRLDTLETQHEILVNYARAHDIDPSIEGRVNRSGLEE